MSKKERFEAEVIPAYVDRINDYEDSKKEVIRELAERIKAEGLVIPELICEYIKIVMRRFKAPISDRTIEMALPETFKRKNVLPPDRNPSVIPPKKVIEQTTGGEHNVRPYREETNKGPTEIDLSTREEMDREREEMADGLELNSNETIRELEEQRDRDRETIKTMQKQIDDLKVESSMFEVKATEAETRRKATQQDFEKLKERTDELEEALRKSIKEGGFSTASELPKTPQTDGIWVRASNVVNVFVALRKAIDVANKQPKFERDKQEARKVILEYEANTGEVKGARLEDV